MWGILNGLKLICAWAVHNRSRVSGDQRLGSKLSTSARYTGERLKAVSTRSRRRINRAREKPG
jgi:hypothetical protein